MRALKAAQDSIKPRANSFELYGADFMVDQDKHVWLLEVRVQLDFPEILDNPNKGQFQLTFIFKLNSILLFFFSID